MALYNDKVMEYFMNPHNVGEIENPDGKGTYGSPVCGDMMQITISVDDNDVITDASSRRSDAAARSLLPAWRPT